MACTRESLLSILTPLLQDLDLSFKEVMQQIGECTSNVNLHVAVTCIRLFCAFLLFFSNHSGRKFQVSQLGSTQ